MDVQQLRWQPKITPYRLLVLLTTIVLGSVKAYAVSQNLDFVATTIEWVTGVVVFSILFILGLFEPDPPRLLTWLMVPDLVPIIFKISSPNPPRYRSDEGRNKPEIYILGYRLLTSVIVACFGILKAYFTYQGSTGAPMRSNGVLESSSLYIPGLYENNPVNMMSGLFFVSYSTTLYHLLVIAIHMMGICSAVLIHRLGNAYGLGHIPPLPSSFSLKELFDFGIELNLFSVLFLAPYSVVAGLSVHLLEFGLGCMASPLSPAVRQVRQNGIEILYRFLSSIWTLGMLMMRLRTSSYILQYIFS